MRRTRFICTIGPKTMTRDWLERLHRGGMGIARVNGAHGSLDDVRAMIERLKADLPAGVEILLDLPGNKIRTDGFEKPIELETGSEFVLEPTMLTYPPLHKSLKTGDVISAADGTIRLEVLAIDGDDVRTKVLVGGMLANRKGINVKGIHGTIPFDFERDIDLLNVAIELGVDHVGLSFVRSPEHVRRIRAQLVDTKIALVAKVETEEAVAHLDEILDQAGMIMIDRGDLEAEVGREQVPLVQKEVIRRASEVGVPVICASQFLCSMLGKPLPFIAEVSDIANAVLDGASLLMLSEETAIGDFPEDCIRTMAAVADAVEDSQSRDFEAVILAAGSSTGFGSLTKNKHKCMLDVGGETIVSHQLANMQEAGIPSEKVTLVTGHNTRQVEAYLGAEVYDGHFVYNPWFQTTNMAVSLWLAQKRDVNFIICYGDIIFEKSILEDLIATPGDIVLAIDDRAGGFDAEDEKVIVADGCVQRCSKEIPDDEATGEFIGLAKITRRGSRRLWRELGSIARENEMMVFLSEIFQRLAFDDYEIRVCNLGGRPWNDNDTLADLGRSRETVFPLIRESKDENR